MSHKKNSKRKQQIKKILETIKDQKFNANEAVKYVKQFPPTKFDQSLEIVVHLGIDTKQADQQIRGTALLPHGSGKKTIVAVIADGDDAKAAQKAGADIIGSQDLISEIQKGNINFDKLVTTPPMMKEGVSKLGRVLGPKGLMPNPKDGTVTNNIENVVEDIKKGRQVSFRAEKDGGVVHVGIGKASFSDEELVDNVVEVISTLQKMKPSAAKGVFFKSAFIKSTMSGSVELDVHQIAQ